ncbi:MAG TPA: tyrosine-type recombinase/integrase [Oculatellaceae cyanobacterium]
MTITDTDQTQTKLRRIARRLPPRKQHSPLLRERRHLTEPEIEKMINCARNQGDLGLRNAVMVMLMYTHALRVSEVIQLKWDDIDVEALSINIDRLNRGVASKQTLSAVEAGLLFRLRRSSLRDASYVFCSDKGVPLARRTIHFIVAKAAQDADLDLNVHPHMLRHARALHLASSGFGVRTLKKFMGHRNVQNTQLYL